MRCPKCSQSMVKNGKRKSGNQRWVCKSCGHSLTEGDNPPHRPRKKELPKDEGRLRSHPSRPSAPKENPLTLTD